MYAEEHDKIIEQLRRYIREDDATFGIFQYGGGADESYIKADRQGLRLFALELLMAAQNRMKFCMIRRRASFRLILKKAG